MFNRLRYTDFLAQISFFVFIILFVCLSHVSGRCSCYLFRCHCKNVQFIPQLPSNVTSVILEDSTCFFQKGFMVNLSTLALEELYFKGARIRWIERDIFVNFPYLKKLSFENSLTHIKALSIAFNSLHQTNISKLLIENLYIGSYLPIFLKTLTNTKITQLSLIRCSLTTFNGELFFSSLRQLRYLNLKTNFINHASWSYAEHLQVLLLNHAEIILPTFLASDATPFFPNLTRLEITVNRIEAMNSSMFEGLTNLEHLFLGIGSETRISKTFLSSIPKIKHLQIQALLSVQSPFLFKLIVDYGAFKSEELQHLELNYFKINVPFKGSLFRHAPNLQILKLKSTKLLLFDNILNEELMFLKKLQTFVLSFSSLEKVPHVLCNLPNLTRIDLGKNWITSWNDTNCPVMSRLLYLSFSENEIHLIEKNTFSPQLIGNDRLIWDLSLNTFLCNCRLLWFMNWSQQKRDRFKFYPSDYVCATPPELKGKSLNSSFFSNGQCSTGSSSSIIIISSSLIASLTFIAIVTASLMYYKRWSIRYFFYLMQSRRKRKKEEKDVRNYTYDVFVCYHNSDIEWLLNELCPKLETENNFSLCIHDRDFIAGRDIAENIIESIEKSRKVLLLLSNQFASSNWCRFETTMAHQRVIEREENLLVVVLLEDIDNSHQSRRLALLLKQKTYLEWTQDKDGQVLFWKRLINCLRAPNLQST